MHDAGSLRTRKVQARVRAVGRRGLPVRIGEQPRIEEWAPGLTFLDDWTYYDDGDPKLGMVRWFARWSLVRWAQWTVHYRLGTGARGGPGTSRTGANKALHLTDALRAVCR